MTGNRARMILLGVSGIALVSIGGMQVAGYGGLYLALGFAMLIVWHANKLRGGK